jgi:thiosulfate dehydrogenase [quinone] large subunit
MKQEKLLAALRIALGWIFLWAFLDKTFGIYPTAAENAWIAGGSPTTGFLANAPSGPFAELFHALAGSPLVDWLFMLGLLGIGLALIFGIAMRLATWSGSILLGLMWLAVLPPEHNPLIDDHIIYILVLILLYKTNAGNAYGLQNWWKKKAPAWLQ